MRKVAEARSGEQVRRNEQVPRRVGPLDSLLSASPHSRLLLAFRRHFVPFFHLFSNLCVRALSSLIPSEKIGALPFRPFPFTLFREGHLVQLPCQIRARNSPRMGFRSAQHHGVPRPSPESLSSSCFVPRPTVSPPTARRGGTPPLRGASSICKK